MSIIDVAEVFSSIQGEGKYVGYRQLFVRLAGCNLACDYCDTPGSREKTAAARIEKFAGSREFSAVDNPLQVAELSRLINDLLDSPHHSVSFTGGEPLLQAEALAELLPQVNGLIYLETNGVLPDKLAAVLDAIDIISMDIKLPSVTGREYWREHREFLKLATSSGVFVKLVLTGQTTDAEFRQALAVVSDVDAGIPVVLQPVTPVANVGGIAPESVLRLQEMALNVLTDVRVIPQTHKFMGQL
jgi:organic radical activating enzyme